MLKIKRALGFFDGRGFNRMRINHGGSDITVAQKLLNGADVVVGLQQMAGKTVAKRVGRCALWYFGRVDGPLDLFLDVGFMKIITSVLIFVRDECHRFCGKKPLPNEFPGGIFIFFLNPVRQKNAGIPCFEIFLMQVDHRLQMIL